MNQEKLNCEVVGIFNSMEELEEAADELFSHGIDHSYLSMLANEKEVKKYLEDKCCTTSELADLPNIHKSPYYGDENIAIGQGALIAGLTYVASLTTASVVIAGGGLLTRLLTTTITAGSAAALFGVFLANLIGKKHADYLNAQLKKGGLLLWVHISEYSKSSLIYDILTKNSAKDVHVHCISKHHYNL